MMSAKELKQLSTTRLSDFFNYNNQYLHYVVVMALITASCLWRNVDGLVGDDGAFFLKYAENMSKGYFWYYNIDSGPIWGASAPLYPLLIAPLIKIGIDPVAAIKIVGISLLNAAGLLGFQYFAKNKSSYGFIFVVLFALNSNIVINSMTGLETPLTVFLICLVVHEMKNYEEMIGNSNQADRSVLKIPFIIGILAINKIDLIPFSFALIIAYCFMINGLKQRVQSIVVPLLILISFHSFAWAYFGYPLPNSFLTKALHQNHLPRIISRDWIFNDLKSTSLIALLAAIAIMIPLLIEFLKVVFNSNHPRSVLVPPMFVRTGLCLSFLGIYVFLGYSIKPPFEPYIWYIAPISLSVCYLATLFVVSIDSQIQLKAV